MDRLMVDIAWKGDNSAAAELLRDIAGKIAAGEPLPVKIINSAGGVVASARIIRDRR